MSNFRNEQILKLDIKQQQPNAIPRFVQDDSASLKIELYDNGKKYDVSKVEEFVISIKRPDGKMLSGLAEFDGEYITYKLAKQDLEVLGEVESRLQIYNGKNRISSLSFRYDVYEDFETVGSAEDQTLLSKLFTQLHDALLEAQRQGNYAENRGEFANSSGDYANEAGDSQKMRWLMYVNTIQERNSKYPNPQNGDTVYVVNVGEGGAVYRYNSIQQPPSWETISGYDTSIIQDIYNVLSTKETKEEVKKITDAITQRFDELTIGGRNYVLNSDKKITKSANSNYARIPDFVFTEIGQYTISFNAVVETETNTFTEHQVYIGRTIGKAIRNNEGRSHLTFTINEDDLNKPVYLYLGSTSEENYPNSGYFEYIKVEKSNKPSDWTPAPEDILNKLEKDLNDLDSKYTTITTKNINDIDYIKNEIKKVIYKEAYDTEMEQLAQWKSEVVRNATNISQEVSKKVGNDEIISKINQSAEAISIDAKKIKLGGDVVIENGLAKIKNIDFTNAIAHGGSSTEYLELKHDELVMRGQYNRVWRGEKLLNNDVITRMINGHLRFRNNTLNRSLYYSDFGISTFLDGEGAGSASGTINFFDYEYSTARGVTMESNLGVVALRSNGNRVVLDAHSTVNLESSESSVYVRPFRDNRAGTNEFRFGVKLNSSADETDGFLVYGDLSNANTGGAGLRFSKARGKNLVYATNSNGDMGTGGFVAESFTGALVAPYDFVYAVGQRLRIIKNLGDTQNFGDLQTAGIQADTLRVNDSGANFYIGVSTGELRVTNNLLYNGGNVGYRPVRASQFIESSSEKYKSNIEAWNYSVLDDIKNNVKLYSYNLNSDLEAGNHTVRHGVIVERETPESWVDGDGVVNYEMVSWALKGVQELAVKNDTLEEQNNELVNRVNELEKQIAEIHSLLSKK